MRKKKLNVWENPTVLNQIGFIVVMSGIWAINHSLGFGILVGFVAVRLIK